jgi:hypothetical protein
MRHFKHAAVMVVVVAAFLAVASSAMAATAPGYEEFDDCPGRDVDPSLQICVVSIVTDGHLKMGTKNTPITDPIELVGSLGPSGQMVVGKFDGGRQKVPGGLVGLTGLDWLTWIYPLSLLNVYAEAELAGTPGNPLVVPFPLPLKVKLDNILLADTCYIGSDSNPIQLNLIGSPEPTLTPDPNLPGVIRLTDGVLTDHTFAAPAATGCDLLGLGAVDLLVNAQAGLPSPSGNNEAVQEVHGALAALPAIYPPDGTEQ